MTKAPQHLREGVQAIKSRYKLVRLKRGELPVAQEARMTAEIRAMKEIAPSDQIVLLVGDPGRPVPDELAGVRVVSHVTSSLREQVRFVWSFLRTHRPRVLHTHTYSSAILGGVARLFLTTNRPIHVYEIHGAVAYESYFRHSHRADRWLRFLVLYLLESLAILLAGRLVLVSHRITRYYPVAALRKRGAVPRYLDPSASDDFSLPPAAFLRFVAESKARKQPLVVYSGGSSKWQLPDETVRLMNSLVLHHGFRAVVFTPNPEVFRSLILAERADGDDWFIDRLERGQVLPSLKLCDVGILLRDDLTLNRVASPTKLYEYLYCGLVVVSSEGAPEAAEIIRTTGTGVVVDLKRLRSSPVENESVGIQILDVLKGLGEPRVRVGEWTWADGARILKRVYGIEGHGRSR